MVCYTRGPGDGINPGMEVRNSPKALTGTATPTSVAGAVSHFGYSQSLLGRVRPVQILRHTLKFRLPRGCPGALSSSAHRKKCSKMARPERFELPTFWFVAEESRLIDHGFSCFWSAVLTIVIPPSVSFGASKTESSGGWT